MSRALTDPQIIHALRERRAEIAGEIVELESRARHLRESLTHVDGVLRMSAPGFDPTSIRAKKPYKRVKLFGHGKLNQLILDSLRQAGRPMTTTEITADVGAAMNFGPDASKSMSSRVRANLLYLSAYRGLVIKEGERTTARWSINQKKLTQMTMSIRPIEAIVGS